MRMRAEAPRHASPENPLQSAWIGFPSGRNHLPRNMTYSRVATLWHFPQGKHEDTAAQILSSRYTRLCPVYHKVEKRVNRLSEFSPFPPSQELPPDGRGITASASATGSRIHREGVIRSVKPQPSSAAHSCMGALGSA